MKVTHLLCLGDEETEKMKYAEKFNKQREAKIWLVWEEWFWDLMEFGGRFREEKYVVSRPRLERKAVADKEPLIGGACLLYLDLGLKNLLVANSGNGLWLPL